MSTFQPAMRGVASAQQLASQADDLRAAAQVAAIQEAENGRIMLANAYTSARDANARAAHEIAGEVQEQIFTFTRRTDTILTAAKSLSYAVPVPLVSSELTGYTKQRVYNSSLIDQAFTSAQQIVDKAMQGAGAEAASILDAAWLCAAPSAPDRALAGGVDDAVLDIRAALGAGRSPADVLKAAIASGDAVLLYALLGEPARRLLTALGGDRTALVKSWAQAQLAKVAPDANGVPPLGAGFPGATFLRLQDGPQALAKLPALAKTYYNAMVERTRALLASTIVQGAMR